MKDLDRKYRLQLEIAKAAYSSARAKMMLLRTQMSEASEQLRAAEELRAMAERELSAIERTATARRDLTDPVMH